MPRYRLWTTALRVSEELNLAEGAIVISAEILSLFEESLQPKRVRVFYLERIED